MRKLKIWRQQQLRKSHPNLIHDNHSQHHLNHSYNQIISKAVQNCINTFGFSSNPLLHTWENAYTTLSSTTQFDYFNRIQNSTFHNLCTSHTPPPNLGRTLALGLKFCIQTPYPQNTMDFERFGRDARLKYIFAGEDSLQYNNTPKRRIATTATQDYRRPSTVLVYKQIPLHLSSSIGHNPSLTQKQGNHWNTDTLSPTQKHVIPGCVQWPTKLDAWHKELETELKAQTHLNLCIGRISPTTKWSLTPASSQKSDPRRKTPTVLE